MQIDKRMYVALAVTGCLGCARMHRSPSDSQIPDVGDDGFAAIDATVVDVGWSVDGAAELDGSGSVHQGCFTDTVALALPSGTWRINGLIGYESGWVVFVDGARGRQAVFVDTEGTFVGQQDIDSRDITDFREYFVLGNSVYTFTFQFAERFDLSRNGFSRVYRPLPLDRTVVGKRGAGFRVFSGALWPGGRPAITDIAADDGSEFGMRATSSRLAPITFLDNAIYPADVFVLGDHVRVIQMGTDTNPSEGPSRMHVVDLLLGDTLGSQVEYRVTSSEIWPSEHLVIAPLGAARFLGIRRDMFGLTNEVEMFSRASTWPLIQSDLASSIISTDAVVVAATQNDLRAFRIEDGATLVNVSLSGELGYDPSLYDRALAVHGDFVAVAYRSPLGFGLRCLVLTGLP